MTMFIISLAVSVVGIIAFVLLRFVLADTLTDRAGDIIQYLMYIIPGILGIAGCVLAVFSLQSDKIRIMSIIAIAVGAIVTIFVIVFMIVFPYEGKTSHTKNDDQDAFAIEETRMHQIRLIPKQMQKKHRMKALKRLMRCFRIMN